MGIFVFIGWLLLSLAVGKFYSNRGGRFLYGTLFALIFSPLIGFIIAAVSNPSQSETNSDKDYLFEDCPLCGEEIKKKAVKCKHCESYLGEKWYMDDPQTIRERVREQSV